VIRDEPVSLSTTPQSRLLAAVVEAIEAGDGWLPFDRFMALALYAPGLGYYSRDDRQFGQMPSSGSDFVTAPELSPLFGRALAAQVQQGLERAGASHVVEFGAGSGALAAQLLDALGDGVSRYDIVELSAALRSRQQQVLARFAPRVHWLDELPASIHGVVVANEVLDAMPVQLLHFDGTQWHERGVVARGAGLAFEDRPTQLRPPGDGRAFLPGTVTEIHLQAVAFLHTLAERLQRGAALFIDYGFPEHEYYHPQRQGGTLMCHHRHTAGTDPLVRLGEQDITAHVNFSAVALAAQDAGLNVDGYTSQARFLFNCGLPPLLAAASVRERVLATKLVDEHEMGELFKVLCVSKDLRWQPLGFVVGDRSHTL
jgi:SAM-dependent MidA family methyltransferase